MHDREVSVFLHAPRKKDGAGMRGAPLSPWEIAKHSPAPRRGCSEAKEGPGVRSLCRSTSNPTSIGGRSVLLWLSLYTYLPVSLGEGPGAKRRSRRGRTPSSCACPPKKRRDRVFFLIPYLFPKSIRVNPFIRVIRVPSSLTAEASSI